MRVLLKCAHRTLPFLVLILGALAPDASAQDGGEESAVPATSSGKLKPGQGSVSYRLGFFDVADSGSGNPFVDESLTVIEPVIIFDRQVTEDTGYSITFSYDNVSSASIDRLSGFSAQSGASGDNYFGLDLGVRYSASPRSDLSGNLSFSTEYDYTSIGLGGALAVEAPDGDSRVTTSVNAYFDQLKLIRGTSASMGQDQGSDNRTSFSGTVKWYQILSPRTHGEFGVTVAHQTGFLETPYNFVVDESVAVNPTIPFENGAQGLDGIEILPDSRSRFALFGRVRGRLGPGHSIELGGRIYQDDWGITSFAIEPAYEASMGAKWRFRPRYRFYTQTAADAFYENYRGEPGDRTQDSDLGDFSSNLFGVKFIKRNNATRSMDVGLDYILRSDGLDQLVFSIGWERGL